MKNLIHLLLLAGCFIQGSCQDGNCLMPLNFKDVLHRLNHLKHDHSQLKESEQFGSNLKLNEFVAKSFAGFSNKSIVQANLSNECLDQLNYWLNALSQKQTWALRSI